MVPISAILVSGSFTLVTDAIEWSLRVAIYTIASADWARDWSTSHETKTGHRDTKDFVFVRSTNSQIHSCAHHAWVTLETLKTLGHMSPSTQSKPSSSTNVATSTVCRCSPEKLAQAEQRSPAERATELNDLVAISQRKALGLFLSSLGKSY